MDYDVDYDVWSLDFWCLVMMLLSDCQKTKYVWYGPIW